MHKLGYEYIELDDCWGAKERDANGNLQPDANRFPSGMKALADYVHSLGLKLGLYTCIGTKTCRNGIPGSYGFYDKDAAQFTAWGIDFVKCDNCNRPGGFTEEQLYSNFSYYLNKTGHTMLFALCEWGNQDVQSWGAKVAQQYRIQMDHLPLWIFPNFAAGEGFGQGTYDIIEYIATLKPSTFVKQYGWMDPDFLMTLFWPSMTYTYSKTEFSFWSLWSAPLVVATNIYNMTAEKMSILMNAEVIAIDQDPLYTAGDRISKDNATSTEIWARPLANGDKAVIAFNGNLFQAFNVTVEWSAVGLGSGSAVVSARDLWAHKDLGNFTGSFTASIEPADCVMLRLTCVKNC
jgi:alpha-galactosidase